jgi:hypothetical protein
MDNANRAAACPSKGRVLKYSLGAISTAGLAQGDAPQAGPILDCSCLDHIFRKEQQMNESLVPTTLQVEKRAYELYLERGGEDGHDFEDWLAAERELIDSSEKSSSVALKSNAASAGGRA